MNSPSLTTTRKRVPMRSPRSCLPRTGSSPRRTKPARSFSAKLVRRCVNGECLRRLTPHGLGWPTNTNVWKPNSPKAVASVASAKAFAQLLDSSCETFKGITPHGGVGWLWHIWSDSMLDGWGLLDWNGNPKWSFAPRTDC